MAISILTLGLIMEFQSQLVTLYPDQEKIFVMALPLCQLIVFMLAFGIGAGMVPWTLLGELVPAKVKLMHQISLNV